MIGQEIIIKKNKLDQLLNILRKFAKKRKYILFENIENSTYTFTIYDKNVEHGGLIDFMDLFIGRSLILQRIRININIIELHDDIKILIRGDVMIPGLDVVDNKPKKRDIIKCEILFKDIIEEVINLK